MTAGVEGVGVGISSESELSARALNRFEDVVEIGGHL